MIETFISTVTGKLFKLNIHFYCHDKCLVYLFTKAACKKPYTGKHLTDLDYARITIKTAIRNS